jgi:uncharacterized protein YbjT (DUF2867 family)
MADPSAARAADTDRSGDDPGPVLVLGSTGTTGRRVVAGLRAEGVPVRAASRTPRPAADPGVEAVRFDWDDPAGHDAALAGARAVYLLGPLVSTAPDEEVLPFVDRALTAGVRRVVLLSGSPFEAGDPGLGRVHAELAASGAEWAVLRPTWFAQNLLDPTHHVGGAVLAGDDVVTATGRGRVGFVDAGDIAAVAVRALLDPVSHDTDHLITGPEALSYDDVAARLSVATGRTVRHRAVSPEEATAHMVTAGMPEAYATALAAMETRIAAGAEDRLSDAVLRVTGRAPRRTADVLADELRARRSPTRESLESR